VLYVYRYVYNRFSRTAIYLVINMPWHNIAPLREVCFLRIIDGNWLSAEPRFIQLGF
jgi:hypothetical protein